MSESTSSTTHEHRGLIVAVARIEGRLDAVLPAITLAAPEPPSSE